MESQRQQPESDAPKFPNAMAASETAPLSNQLSAPQINEKWWWRIGSQVSVWLGQLPDYLGRLFNQYKQALISLALILAAIITLKVVLAVMDALNDLPLLVSTFKLVGIGYTVWFVNRYLLRASTRQELFQLIQVQLRQAPND